MSDFGLVKLLGKEGELEFYTRSIVGTPNYMAPEVYFVFERIMFLFAGVDQPQRLLSGSRCVVAWLHHGVSVNLRLNLG